MLPKNIALKKNETIALLIALSLYIIKQIIRPVLNGIQILNQYFLIHFKHHLRQPNPYITIEELKTGVVEAAQRKVISTDEQDIIIGILSGGALPVRKLMTHRSSLVILTDSITVGNAVARLSESKQNFGLIRAKGGATQILGTVALGRLLGVDPYKSIKGEITTPLWVPETMVVADLMSFLLGEGRTEACVLDEFGSFSGAFSLTVGLNKILYNAFPGEEKKGKRALQCSTMMFSGLQDVEKIEDWLPAALKSLTKDSRTLNGVITRYLGKIPKTGDRFAINGWNFYIMDANPTKIESVLIRRGDDREC
jgi:putative hemolysin